MADKILEMLKYEVDLQAQDPWLWGYVGGKDWREAALQKALRRLHEIIEQKTPVEILRERGLLGDG